ncbi:hypothetical protein [Microbacterium indicum]|uniref:hypothetical protein n=1 Tax=Microbacterium indicum TaxID=358100 RepID=UPI0012EB78B9|nr:hypothetical protein [Microbacterium indicum]
MSKPTRRVRPHRVFHEEHRDGWLIRIIQPDNYIDVYAAPATWPSTARSEFFGMVQENFTDRRLTGVLFQGATSQHLAWMLRILDRARCEDLEDLPWKWHRMPGARVRDLEVGHILPSDEAVLSEVRDILERAELELEAA